MKKLIKASFPAKPLQSFVELIALPCHFSRCEGVVSVKDTSTYSLMAG